MNPKNCPSPDELEGYVLGTVLETEAEAIEEHVETCADCETRVESLEAQPDAVVANLRQPRPPDSEWESGEWRAALAKVEAAAAKLAQPAEHAPRAAGGPSEQPIRLGEYELLAKLGEGGMGAVYKAQHTKLDKLVALKVLPKDRMRNASAVARFEREMKAVGRLNHVHIVQAHDAREIDGTHFLAMEYVEGLDLAKLVSATGRLRVEDACELIRQAAVGLQHAHEQGLVHRDIKPSNLMLNRQATVKILDLGLALLGTGQSSHQEMTAAGTAMGTADYVSPEQVTDSHSVDIRSDIYSLGCTLYKLLLGRAPFAGPEFKNDIIKMMAHVQQTPPSISLLRTDLPPGLAEIIHRMMAKKPQDRFGTPGEVAAALEPFAAGNDLGRLLNEAHRALGLPAVETPRSGSAVNLDGSVRTDTAVPARVATLTQGQDLERSDLAVERKPRRFAPRQLLIASGAAAAALLLVLLAAPIIIRITHKDGQVTEIHVPPGAQVEIVEGEKAPVRQAFQPDEHGRQAGKPDVHAGKPDLPLPDKAKPFVLLRNGTQAGEFKGLGGALAALQAGDEIVVHGNGPFTIPSTRLNTGLVLRAAPGFRPRFVVGKPAPNEQAVLNVPGPLVVEGCDFVSPEPVVIFAGNDGPCEFRACRCCTPSMGATTGTLVAWGNSKSLIVRDCLLLNHDIRTETGEMEVELQNNIACQTWGHILSIWPSQKVRLIHNTMVAGVHTSGSVIGLNFGELPRRPTTVEAVGNILFSDAVLHSLMPPADMKDTVSWRGRDNLYVGPTQFLVWQHHDKLHVVECVVKDFAAWKARWGGEEGSRHVERVAFPSSVFVHGTPEQSLRWLQERVATIRQQLGPEIEEFRPQWDLIGPGEAYVRALAVAGNPVSKDQLRPEELEGGPFVLIRDGKAFRGYAKLQDAVHAVQDGDTIEIRTDGPVAACQFGVPATVCAVTMRAAPGYRPIISDVTVNPSALRLTVEGLHFQNAGLVVANPVKQGCGLARLANCSFEGERSLRAAYWAPEGAAMEIHNCLIPRGLSTARQDAQDTTRLSISHSVLGTIGSDVLERPLPVALRQCIVESPGLVAGRESGACFISPTDTTAEQTLFDTAGWLGAHPKRSWKGTGNIYSLGVRRPPVEELRTPWKSPEEGSLEADPAILDPRNWQLLLSSPGYRQGPGGRDYGADVSRVASSSSAAQAVGQAFQPDVRPGQAGKPDVPAGSAADRRAADWVLSLGGYGNMVTIRVGDQEKNISAVKDLPAGEWQLVKVELREKATDKGLEHFKGLTNLTNLMICGPGVTDGGLPHLKGLTNLHSLGLHGTAVTDAGLEHLKSLANLRSLIVQISRIGDAVSGNGVRDAGLRHLRDFAKLTYLELSGQELTDAGLEQLGALAGLENLDLSATSVSDTGLKHLQGLTNLQHVGLDETSVTDAGLEHLKDLPRLISLFLRRTRVTDASLPILVNHGARLRLDDARVSAKGFANLKMALPGADIVWSERNRTAAEAVLAAGGKLSVRTKGQPDDRPIAAVSELPTEYFPVSRVSLVDVPKIPDDLFGKLSALNDPNFDNLEVLDLSGSPIQDCRGLDGLTTLKDLSLAQTKVGDAGLEPLKRLKNLRRLVLDGCAISGPGLQHLKGLPNLTELRLACPSLGDLGVMAVGQMKTLERLSLAGTSVSDEGLKHLHGLMNLKALVLSQTKVTAAGLAEMQKALPQCQIKFDPAAKPAQ